jgi:hypothetical protein
MDCDNLERLISGIIESSIIYTNDLAQDSPEMLREIADKYDKCSIKPTTQTSVAE